MRRRASTVDPAAGGRIDGTDRPSARASCSRPERTYRSPRANPPAILAPEDRRAKPSSTSNPQRARSMEFAPLAAFTLFRADAAGRHSSPFVRSAVLRTRPQDVVTRTRKGGGMRQHGCIQGKIEPPLGWGGPKGGNAVRTEEKGKVRMLMARRRFERVRERGVHTRDETTGTRIGCQVGRSHR